MNIEQAIGQKCKDIYQVYQDFLERESKGLIFYDSPVLTQIARIVNVDSLNILYELGKDIPSLLRLTIYQEQPKQYVALSDFAYSFRNVRFRSEHEYVLQHTLDLLNEQMTRLTCLCSSLLKETNELTLEEAKAIAWDTLPSVSDYNGNDYLAVIKNPFPTQVGNDSFFYEIDQPPFKFRFFKTYLNDLCVGWEFFSQE